MLNLEDTVIPISDVVVTELEGEGVLLNLDTKMYYSLNATGLYIWQILGEGRSLADVGNQLQQAYGISNEQAEKSVLNLANSLHSEHLVTCQHG